MKIILLFITILIVNGNAHSATDLLKEIILTQKVKKINGLEDSNQEKDSINEVEYSLLFVGNSLTYSNNLPKLVEKNARARGIIVKTKMLAYANYAIVDHWADGEVQELVKTKEYDFVIIQQGPSSQQNGYDMLVNSGRLYSDLCKANDAKLAYFMVWPSRAYYHTFDGVIANYTAGAKANDAILSPVGRVWKDHFDNTGDFSYYGPDQFHPSLKGSLVAAEVIVDSLFEENLKDDNLQQAWLIGVGQINDNSIQVEEMYITENGAFGDHFNPDEINNIYWGELNIDFNSCNTANMSYSSKITLTNGKFGSGAYSIARLAQNEQAINCDETGFLNNNDKSFFSGTFYGGSERSGEGFMIDYLSDSRAIVTWFTYLPEIE